MKNVRKLVGILLALVLVVSVMSVTALADTPTTYTITINNTTSGYVYTAYQIFAGDLAEANGVKVLSNVTWGSNITTTRTEEQVDYNIYTELAAISTGEDPNKVYPFQSATSEPLTSAAEVAEALEDYLTYDNEVAKAFADVVSKYITGTGTASDTTSGQTVRKLPTGGYS